MIRGDILKLLNTIHGVFSDEKSYNIWCKINKKKPVKKLNIETQVETIKISNDYDVEKRERKL